jgi:hypothetical protein
MGFDGTGLELYIWALFTRTYLLLVYGGTVNSGLFTKIVSNT